MHVSDFQDYRKFIKTTLAQGPKQGRGGLKKIADVLGLSTSVVSQILSGGRNLSLEHACRLAQYFGLNEKETDYLLTLIELDRAGTENLRIILRQRLQETKTQFTKVVHRIPKSHTLSEAEQTQFYSLWYYSAIRILTSLDRYQTVDALATHLGLPKREVRRVVEFLLETGLCSSKKNLIQMGKKRTHLPADSPFAARHHSNWRLKTVEWSSHLGADDLLYTSLLSISEKDFLVIQERLRELIAEINPIVDASTPETVVLFTLDWLKFQPKACDRTGAP